MEDKKIEDLKKKELKAKEQESTKGGGFEYKMTKFGEMYGDVPPASIGG
jgi:hypothetical protein